ncbi:hypothetical protein PR048_012078 [Dryococelus australis]|uniref:Uncharacterized protein n=1 Tax=Dryococelus australis TaxID=614101 RepID=A0ABQ9HNF6_9NEOP|nr:hypothetical protein PR048_012078 [Dryococelus australis]
MNYRYSLQKRRKAIIVGETLIKPCLLKAADIVLGPECKLQLSQIPLSDNTVNVALMLDESTGFAQCSQLLVFVRYIQDETMKD